MPRYICFLGSDLETDCDFQSIDDISHFEYNRNKLYRALIECDHKKLRCIDLSNVKPNREMKWALKVVLPRCENLESLRVNYKYKIKLAWLNNCKKLTSLFVNTDDSLIDFELKNQIKCLGDTEIDNEILSNYPNLIHAHCDMRPTEKVFNLEKCFLDPKTENEIEEAAKSFPFLQKIKLSFMKFPIKGLNNFKHLTSFSVLDCKFDFETEQLKGLEKLQSFELVCKTVDIGSFGHFCPSLKKLKIKFEHETIGQFCKPLPNLKQLDIESKSESISKDTLMTLVSENQFDAFELIPAGLVDDKFIKEKIECFKNTYRFSLYDCNITEKGFEFLLENMPDLKFLEFCACKFGSESVDEIVKRINPLVEVLIFANPEERIACQARMFASDRSIEEKKSDGSCEEESSESDSSCEEESSESDSSFEEESSESDSSFEEESSESDSSFEEINSLSDSSLEEKNSELDSSFEEKTVEEKTDCKFEEKTVEEKTVEEKTDGKFEEKTVEEKTDGKFEEKTVEEKTNSKFEDLI